MKGSSYSEQPPEYDWSFLVPKVVHPIRVGIIEALRHLQIPLSATDLTHIFDGRHDLSNVSYHLTSLAEFGVVKKVRTRRVRGATETFYAFR